MIQEEKHEDNYSFEEFEEDHNINAILNDQQESQFGILRNLMIIVLIIAVGIGVFWGSFILGKKVFTSSMQQTVAKEEVKLDEDMIDFAMPEEEILYEIETIDRMAKHENKEEKKAASKPVEKTTPKPAPKPVAKPTPKPVAKPVPKPAGKRVMYKVIAGSYSKYENAEELKKQLNANKIDVYIAPIKVKGNTMYRVQVGAFDTEDQAKTMIKQVKAKGHDAFYIQE